MRAFSLCAPVSFHDEVLNERDKEVAKKISPFKAEEAMGDVVSANIITEARKIGAKVPYESLHLSLGADAEPDGSNIVKLTTSLLACEEISDSNHHLTSRNVGDEYFHAEEEWDKFKVRETGSPRRARALSDLSIIESRAGCFQQKNWGKESSPLVNSLTMDSRPSCAVILNVADRPILPRAPHQESATQGNTISLIPPCNPHAAKIDQVALSAVVGDKVLEEVTTPPSWSWTWGSLPVKSKNKISCTDLSHPTDMGSKCSAPVTSSTINLAPDSAFSLSATEDIPISNLLPSNTGQEYSCDSHSITVFDTLDANTSQSMAEIATNDTKDIIVVEVRDPLDTGAGVDADINGAREMRDHHVKDSLCEDTSRPASIPLYVGGASASKTDDIIQLNIMEAKPDETIGMKIEETIGTATDADADKALNFKWGHSLAEFSQATFGLYRPNINLGNRDKPHADGSQPDLLKAFVKGDPSHADMWRWDALSESEIGGADKMGGGGRGGVEGVRIVRGSLPLSQSTDRRSVQRVPEAGVNNNNTSEKFDPSKDSAACTIGKQQGVAGSEKEVEIDGDGDTDQELDTFSLHDIPLDMISPEPAGGDFYDSDTESYLSLSLDDGESGKNDFKKPRKYRYRRVLVPSQDQLRSLDLNDGENEVTFELQSQEIKRGYAGIIPPLHTQLFVWPPDAKIVVIDIEGAITAVSKGSKGWGMGGFLSVPRTAVHNGVIKLLTNIHRNGYRILYIAQSISTTSGTREHLAKIAASSDIKLPPGPVFQSPDSLIRAFGPTRTDVFKAAALR